MEILGDVSSLIIMTMKLNYLLAMALQIGVSCGITTVVYLVGAGEFRIKAKKLIWKEH